MKGDLDVALSKEWKLSLNGTLSWTPSINEGEPRSPADKSVGKQLPYVPEYSSTVTGRLSWKSWSFLYKWCYYSERFTMSSNDITLTGKLPKYFMSNIALEKVVSCKWADFSIKNKHGAVFLHRVFLFRIQSGRYFLLFSVFRIWRGAQARRHGSLRRAWPSRCTHLQNHFLPMHRHGWFPAAAWWCKD